MSECRDQLDIFLEPGVVGRVAAEVFDLDPARVSVPPLDGLDLPQLRAVMGTVDAELTTGAAERLTLAEFPRGVVPAGLRRIKRPDETRYGVRANLA